MGNGRPGGSPKEKELFPPDVNEPLLGTELEELVKFRNFVKFASGTSTESVVFG